MDKFDNAILTDEFKTNEHPNVHLFSFSDPLDCPLYEQIKLGKKEVEGRKNSDKYQKVKVGDDMLLSDKKKGILHCKVTYINRYSDVEEYINGEGLEKVFGDPLKCRSTTNPKEGLKIYEEFVPTDEIVELKKKFGHGFLGVGIEFIHEYRRFFDTLNEPWFSAISDGRKKIEGRINKKWIAELHELDMIRFERVAPPGEVVNSDETPRNVTVIVRKLKKYKSFTELFDENGLENVLPGKTTYEEGISVYRKWYSAEEEKEKGVIGIFIDVISKND